MTAEQPPQAPQQGWLRENLEAIVVAILLALLIRQYALEAFVIPTGSMAPALLGAHLDLKCTNCGFEQSVAEQHVSRTRASPAPPNAQGKCPTCGRLHRVNLLDDSFIGGRAEVGCDACGARVPVAYIPPAARRDDGGRGAEDRRIAAFCSNCRFEFEAEISANRWPWGDVSRGDRILVNKFLYHFQPPGRYEVAVFKFPTRPGENFIKRLIGLPGETIDVQNGDIFVAGKIARKPDDVQRSLWRIVHDARCVEKDQTAGGRTPAWRVDGAAKWTRVEGTAWRGDAGTGTGTDGWLVYARDIRDWNPYNEPGNSGDDHIVGDVRVRFRAKLEGDASAALARITVDDEAVEVEAGGAAGLAVRWRGQEAGLGTSGAAAASIDWSEEHAIALWRADAAIAVEVDGEVLHRFRLDDAPREGGTRRSEVRIGARGGAAVFRDLAVERDAYYLRELRGQRVRFPYPVPPERYFFLGDNSSNSTDSRAWETVPAGHIVGRAFLVFWPAVPGDFAVRRIR